jgi:hypothetical protein
MDQSGLQSKQDQALRDRPHLAFVMECLGLAHLSKNTPHQKLMTGLDRCLQSLVATFGTADNLPGMPTASLAMWLDRAVEEFNSLSANDFPALLEACSGNTMPEWLKDKVRSELGESTSDLITACLGCL